MITTIPVTDKGGAKLKGLRKTVYGGAAAAIGLFFAGLISYVVEHGELPAWSSGALSWLYSLMTLEAPLALWKVLLCILIPSLGFGTLVYYWGRKYDLLVDDYNKQNGRFSIAEVARAKLKKDYVELEATNAKLLDENSVLKVQNQSIPNEQSTQVALTETHFDILLLVADCENASVIPTISNLSARSELTKVALASTLDDLRDLGYVLRFNMGLDKKIQLTPSGRKLVLSKGQV
ncbi:MarR family winged helix-turn-helix transcriptional regulator [Pseudomonas syringae]|uniref:MarR family winged helix-turn-helix transcriptional regulator n=1 Tax=Pseudomonas syringae TaxID=317 RepID=UPI001BCD535A|nr:MarR family winged helix-turn-helix transcriptional regulator [Pseudomonas syringae]QVI77588.1 winged helix-turn-helix transcriptional regulator [Pseudomonas syringae]